MADKHCVYCEQDGHTWEAHLGLLGIDPPITPGFQVVHSQPIHSESGVTE